MFGTDTDREAGAHPRDAGSSVWMVALERWSVALEIKSRFLSSSHKPPDVQPAIRRQCAALLAVALCVSAYHRGPSIRMAMVLLAITGIIAHKNQFRTTSMVGECSTS